MNVMTKAGLTKELLGLIVAGGCGSLQGSPKEPQGLVVKKTNRVLKKSILGNYGS